MGERQITAKVKKLSWERIWLHMEVEVAFAQDADKDSKLSFYLVNGLFEPKARLQVTAVEGNTYKLRVNVTNPGTGLCLPQGTYSMIICQKKRQMAKAEIAEALVKEMSSASRNFLYGGRAKVYSVTFYVTEGDEGLPFIMYVLAGGRTGISAPVAHTKKGFHPKEELKKKYSKINKPLKVDMYWKYRKKYKHKSKKPVVMFMSEQSTSISTNLKAVKDRMLARGMDQDYIIVESYRSSVTNPRQGLKSWMDMLKKMAMSDFIFLDDHAPVLDWLILDKDTTLVQLWHAGAGFKSSGYSRWGHIGCPAPYSCHRQYKYGISGSKNIAHFFSEVWGINDSQVLPTGMPRIDEFLDEAYRKKKTKELYEKYPMCKDKKVILFAPTYRGTNKANAHYPYELIDFPKLYELCGDEYVVLFKMHPWVASAVPIPEQYKDRFADVGRYPNINDLFYFTELLITDYSSNIFEYSLMRKPMLFFAFDEIQYSFSRGFHRPYEESAPGKVCHTFAEVLEAIAQKDFDYPKVEEYVEKHFDHIDSHASDRVIDWVILGQLPDEVKKDLASDAAINRELETLDFKPARS
ncbi:MAG: CDP-glycerol glycerophosphotransferase family protein [Eubacterium sp.]|nr:CDP-glycerol glycerophosphotransferase family protein [Eubacterium sp.]